jgi:hypothetical protein
VARGQLMEHFISSIRVYTESAAKLTLQPERERYISHKRRLVA